MNDPKPSFTERLVAADRPMPDARQRYEKELKAMFEKSLSPRQRGAYLLGSAFLLAIAGFFGLTASFAPELKGEFFPYIMAYFVMTAVASLAAAYMLGRGFWSGSVRRNGIAVVGIGVIYLGLLGWIFMLMARHIPELLRDDVRVFGLVLLIYAAVAWVRHRIAQAELVTNQKMLELELRLAEIGETVKGKSM
jgi:hypothetical protein